MRSDVALPRLVAEARSQTVLILAHLEPHPTGAALGLGGTALGVLAYNSEWAWRDTVAALAMAIALAGLALHGLWRRPGAGWRVDFAARRVEPMDQRGETVLVEGDGWSIATAPGDRRAHVAIDLRHRDRGRVARLLNRPARSQTTITQISALADVLAERLGAERVGPRA